MAHVDTGMVFKILNNSKAWALTKNGRMLVLDIGAVLSKVHPDLVSDLYILDH